ncbi:MAG: metallophosphoesterase [Akkermansiaceae bacterium]|nr:metallophosphoesterase [Akkermansiaceae bacterium]
MTTFIHTADWQVGKPFQSIKDHAKREALRAQRITTVQSLQQAVKTHKADFVVVAGDLFDSFTPDKSTVAAFCSAVGSLGVPVYAIPGNHDYAGPGCIWDQEFFLREQKASAPNFHLLRLAEPVITDHAVLLPCPLLRRHETADPFAWLYQLDTADLPTDRPWLVLAHGSTQGFSSASEEDTDAAINDLNIDRLPDTIYDYIALGDWHGMKEITAKAWYSGTPEQDRFAKGDNNQPGHALVVEIPSRHAAPAVTPLDTGCIRWHELSFDLQSDDALESFQQSLAQQLGTRANEDLLKLHLTGSLSLDGERRLEDLLESLEARLLNLRLKRSIAVEPSEDELNALTERDDPLIAAIAAELKSASDNAHDPESAAQARLALRELHLQLQSIS